MKGRSTADLLRTADIAVAESAVLETTDCLRVDSDSLTIDETVDAILSRTTWPP